MIYLASPYSSPSREVRVLRFQAACLAAATLMQRGFHVFSPIAHTHSIAEQGELPKGFDFWKDFDLWFLSRCDRVIVLQLPGWGESKGVEQETRQAAVLGKSVVYRTQKQLQEYPLALL